jgi:hypothetical protein
MPEPFPDRSEAAAVFDRAAMAGYLGAPPVQEWVGLTERFGSMATRQYLVVLGTALLARATCGRINPLILDRSARPGQGLRAYQAEALANSVLLPKAAQYGLDLRLSRSEAQGFDPFPGALRLDRSLPVPHPDELDELVSACEKVGRLSQRQAMFALAAFIWVCGPRRPKRASAARAPRARAWAAVEAAMAGAARRLEKVRQVGPFLAPELPFACALLIAVDIWVASIPSIDLAGLGDVGLITVLPPATLLATTILTFSAALLLRRQRLNGALLALHLIALVVMLYAIPSILEPLPQFSTTYVHVGLSEYITRTGAVAPELEARFDWPGFFILGSFLSQMCGFAGTLNFAAWAPVYFNLLYLAPLALIGRALTGDPRLAFGAVWLFEIANWVGQDYFSPQGLNYFLFLVIVALVLTEFRSTGSRPERWLAWIRSARPVTFLLGQLPAEPAEEEPGSRASPKQAAGILVCLTAVFAFVAFSHQLTPFFTVSGLLALVIFNQVRLRSSPLLFGALTVGWISYMTVPFLQGHVIELIADVGQVNATLTSNVANRVTGSSGHHLVVTACLAFTAGMMVLAALGALVRFRDGRRDLALLLLLCAPAPLVALQAYGGEMLLRVYLFCLPFAAVLGVGIVYGRPGGIPGLRGTVLAAAAASAIVGVFFLTRFGNERMDIMTPSEMQAVDAAYQIAPQGSLLVSADTNLPWRFAHFEQYLCLPDSDILLVSDPRTLATRIRAMAGSRPKAYLILTASEKAYAEMFFDLTPDAWDGFVASLKASPDFRLVYQNSQADIFELVGGSATASAP